MYETIGAHFLTSGYANLSNMSPNSAPFFAVFLAVPQIEALLKNGATQKFIAQHYDATEATVSRWINKQGLQKK